MPTTGEQLAARADALGSLEGVARELATVAGALAIAVDALRSPLPDTQRAALDTSYERYPEQYLRAALGDGDIDSMARALQGGGSPAADGVGPGPMPGAWLGTAQDAWLGPAQDAAVAECTRRLETLLQAVYGSQETGTEWAAAVLHAARAMR